MNKISILTLLLFTIFDASSQKRIQLKDIYKDNLFEEKTIKGLKSTNNGKYYTIIENNASIVKYSYKSNEKIAELFTCKKQNILKSIDDYSLSKDGKKLLLITEKEKLYRYSYWAKYYVWDMDDKVLIPITNEKLRMAEFSPTGNAIAYVKDNNLFIFDISNRYIQQITFDGQYNKTINGIPDWVYEEEFGYNKAFEWLAGGRYLAYKKFDESKVPIYNLIHYTKKSKHYLYPKIYSFKYPKAGEKNSTISIHIYDTHKKITQDYNFEEDVYIPRIIPTKNPNQLLALKLNRRQNEMQYIILHADSEQTKIIYKEKEKQYIDADNFDFITVINEHNSFIYLSEKDGFNHIYLYNGKAKEITPITRGNWDVTDFYGYQSDTETIFYQAATNNPMQREIFSKNIKTKKTKLLSQTRGFNKALFNSQCTYFVNFYSTLNHPTTITLYNFKGKKIRVLENNTNIREKIKNYTIPKKKFIHIPSAIKDIRLNAWILLPNDFKKDEKYPLVITQYSGPNSQRVLDKWQFDWTYYLTQQGYIVVCIDTRGTGARGEEFRKSTYLQLGKLETQDLIATAKFLSTKNFIDKSKIAIWGWSYGGFTSLSCLFKSNLFNTAIAVAPVTNWRFYDTIYTERFMRKPKENPTGYDANSPLNMVENYKHGNLLLVHGTADDNVHIQNSTSLSEKLVQANKQFDLHYYSDKNHSIYGGNTQLHLFTLTFNFLEKNLK